MQVPYSQANASYNIQQSVCHGFHVAYHHSRGIHNYLKHRVIIFLLDGTKPRMALKFSVSDNKIRTKILAPQSGAIFLLKITNIYMIA